jgi:membrane dipeptidase
MKVLLLLVFSACALSPKDDPEYEKKVQQYAKNVHEKVFTLDTHVDIDLKNYTANRNPGMRLPSQVDLIKMAEGGLDGAFFIVFTSQGPRTKEGYKKAYLEARQKFSAIRNMAINWNKDKISLATSTKQVQELFNKDKTVALIGVENPYPIGLDLSVLDKYYDLGARYVSLTHNGHSQFADSNVPKGDEPEVLYNGLNKRGRALVKKLNDLGIMVDVSHSSKKSMLDAVRLSKVPVIASHSALRALCDHPRNLDDEQLMALKKNRGVLQVVAFSTYLKPKSVAREKAELELNKKYGIALNFYRGYSALSDEKKYSYGHELDAIRLKYPHATVADFVDHIDYAVEKMGIDHVGIASDFDGGGGLDDWRDASETLNVTAELVRRGYSFSDIQKIWGSNLLRVMKAAESYSAAKK